jgi:hypothetical protein
MLKNVVSFVSIRVENLSEEWKVWIVQYQHDDHGVFAAVEHKPEQE